MNTLNQTLDEKMRIDAELAEMDKYPIDFSDIPPMQDADRQRLRFGHERFLKMLPPDMVKALARQRLEQIKAADCEVRETVGVVVA
ncbi:MAG: hypothetical protein LBS97_07615 [Treponema sp.]|jgi:hypothetical protein|nr:hypothetical protein [Treponema sp.]